LLGSADAALERATAVHIAAASELRAAATDAAATARTIASHMSAYDVRHIPAPLRCVLVVDDDTAARAALVALLRAGLPGVMLFDADSVTTAKIAVAAYRPAVVVVDYVLRVGRSSASSGLSLLYDLPRVHRGVIVSGHANLADLSAPLRALGAEAFTRPLTSTEAAPLVAHVRALLDAAAPEAP
jgi:DNA-binding NtrC family response regulator